MEFRAITFSGLLKLETLVQQKMPHFSNSSFILYKLEKKPKCLTIMSIRPSNLTIFKAPRSRIQTLGPDYYGHVIKMK